MKDTVRLAVAQARVWTGDEAPRMLEDALRYVDEAGKVGADVLLFPEHYPGPVTHELQYDVIGPLREAAKRNRVAVAAGTIVPVAGEIGVYHLSQAVINSNGDLMGFYHRTHPVDHIYRPMYFSSGRFMRFQYRAGTEFPVFEMEWGTLGISICSEMFVPEVARILALQGAEVCLFPAGSMIHDLGWIDTWHTVLRARAIENLMYTASCQNLFDESLRKHYIKGTAPDLDPATGVNQGLACIMSPEGVVSTMPGEGLLVSEVSLKRIREMRMTQEFPQGIIAPPPFKTVPGVHALRRPELTAPYLAKEARTLVEYPR